MKTREPTARKRGQKLSEGEKSTYNIGQIAKLANLTTSTIRFYEEIGLLAPSRKTASSHRQYEKVHLVSLNFINRAKTLGMSLEEIKELVDLFGKDPVKKEGVTRALEILDTRLLHIETTIKELNALSIAIKQEQNRLRGLIRKK